MGNPIADMAKLRAIIACESDLRKELAQGRKEGDAMHAVRSGIARRVALLQREVKRQEDPGLFARLRRRAHGHNETVLRERVQRFEEASEQLAESETALAMRIADTSKIAARLSQVSLASKQLAILQEQRKLELLADKGPDGDEIRALTTTLERHAQTKRHLNELIGITEHAVRSYAEILNVKRELDALPSERGADNPSTPGNRHRATLIQRIQQHSPYVQQTLRDATGALRARNLQEAGVSDIILDDELTRLTAVQSADLGGGIADNAVFNRATEAAQDLESVVLALSGMHTQVALEEERIGQTIDVRIGM
ncbi:MAG: hypothetical protein JKY56_23870 [Kofleriaceae bacterium]|nr:hypothetical protein [Kofleriaceae bacterium]